MPDGCLLVAHNSGCDSFYDANFCGLLHFDFAALAGGLLICYLFGTVWYQVVYGIRGSSYSFGMAALICVFPYIIPDIIKLVPAWVISKKMRKIIKNFIF